MGSREWAGDKRLDSRGLKWRWTQQDGDQLEGAGSDREKALSESLGPGSGDLEVDRYRAALHGRSYVEVLSYAKEYPGGGGRVGLPLT